MLKDYRLPPLNGGDAKRAVIFLHGLGDSGAGGLLSIGQLWQSAWTDCEFLCPDAPDPLDMAPENYGGRQWFSLQSFAPGSMLASARKAAPTLNTYIDHVLATRNLTPDKLAIVGFSQGTIMALYAMPRRAQPVASIVGYSGLLIGGETLATEKKSSPPVLLVHGTMDEVVPFAAMDAAARGLKAAQIPVDFLSCPSIGHTIDDAGLEAGFRFIAKGWNS